MREIVCRASLSGHVEAFRSAELLLRPKNSRSTLQSRGQQAAPLKRDIQVNAAPEEDMRSSLTEEETGGREK